MTRISADMRAKERERLEGLLASVTHDLEVMPRHKVGSRWEIDRRAEREYLEKAIGRYREACE